MDQKIYPDLHGIDTWERARELRLGIWALRVIVDEVLDVSYETAPSLGLQPEDLVSDDWSACQAAASIPYLTARYCASRR